MKIHCLKIKSCYYEALVDGSKTFELRRNDRDFKVGDMITFCIVRDVGGLSFPTNLFLITYVLKDCPQYGLADGYAVLGLRKPSKADYGF